jgi:haloacetate dehalogenase
MTSTIKPIVNHTLRANGIRQHYLDSGSGPVVVLLHGFPETNFAWRFQIPVLANQFRVIAPDLRGYGETDKPASGYDKRNMAQDLIALLDELGIDKIALVGHDRGARVATRFAKDHPHRLDRLVVMDNVPTRVVAQNMNAQTARAYWFFLFHLVPDLPETLISGKEAEWLHHFFADWCYNPHAIEGSDFDTMSGRTRIRAPCAERCPTIGRMPRMSNRISPTRILKSLARPWLSGAKTSMR